MLPTDVSRFADDTAKQDRQNQWLKNLKSDIYLNETVGIMNNIISEKAIVRSN
ncbi:MAG: hypothetical protein M9933_08855 [Chitinophagaceae bacterium]|nr:hypothetical protein [Chitinophagaceae bacterium]